MSSPAPKHGFWSRTGRWLRIATHPATHFSLAFLTLGGFVAGVLFWGAFNTALEFANTETFCISRHEMRDNTYAELHGTIHWTNRSGVRATCSDCHVPHAWTYKIARKMAASREIWGHLFGLIDTRDKFLATRSTLAQHEWARMSANHSQECRNCHNPASMDLSKQSEQAARVHKEQLLTGEKSCIDCHKGIAHKLPAVDQVEGFD
jgi:cytochrome c-type protein NapC